MRDVNGVYAQAFNRRHRRVGHLWQARYKAILVEDGPYFLECSRYIHLNPNRSRLTRPAERYRWSSYLNYVGGSACASWVAVDRTLSHFGGKADRYRAWVEGGRGEKPVSPYERAVAGLALGGDEFVARVRNVLRGHPACPEQPAHKRLVRPDAVTPDRIESAVEALFRGQPSRRLLRLKLYALRMHSMLPARVIATRLGRASSTVSMAVRQLREMARRDHQLAAGLEALESHLEELES